MRLVERARAHPWLAAAGAGVLVGVVVGLFLPIRAALPPKAGEAAWLLPTPAVVKRFDENQYQSVRSARYWGELKAAGGRGQPQASSWSLSAIVTRPAVRIAITAPGKQVVSWVTPGGKLPDGAIFVAANRDTVWFEKDGCKRARTLYKKPTAESDACIGAQAAPASASPGRPAPAAAPPAPSPAAPPARNPH